MTGSDVERHLSFIHSRVQKFSRCRFFHVRLHHMQDVVSRSNSFPSRMIAFYQGDVTLEDVAQWLDAGDCGLEQIVIAKTPGGFQ